MERLVTSASASDERAKHVCEPDKVVCALRARLRWEKDRESIRQLAVTRVAWGKSEWL
jgi:hypothetical protein